MFGKTHSHAHRFMAAVAILFSLGTGVGIATAPTPVPWEQAPAPEVPSVPATISADTASASPQKSALETKLRAIASRYSDMEIGIAVTDISSGEHVSIRGDKSFPMASAFKLPVMVETVRQIQSADRDFTLDYKMCVTNETKCIGSGTMASLPEGSTVTVREAIEKMITVSDNTATDMLLAEVSTRSVHRLLQDLDMKHSSVYMSNRQAWILSLRRGVPHSDSVSSFLDYWNSLSFKQKFDTAQQVGTRYASTSLAELQSWEDASARQESYAQSAAIAAAVDNMGSPNDYNHLLQLLWKRQILEERWTQYCLGVLGRQQYNSRIPGLLPKGTRVYHKTGTITGVVNDTGIMMVGNRPVAISVFVDKVGANRSGAATKAISELSLAAYKHFK